MTFESVAAGAQLPGMALLMSDDVGDRRDVKHNITVYSSEIRHDGVGNPRLERRCMRCLVFVLMGVKRWLVLSM